VSEHESLLDKLALAWLWVTTRPRVARWRARRRLHRAGLYHEGLVELYAKYSSEIARERFKLSRATRRINGFTKAVQRDRPQADTLCQQAHGLAGECDPPAFDSLVRDREAELDLLKANLADLNRRLSEVESVALRQGPRASAASASPPAFGSQVHKRRADVDRLKASLAKLNQRLSAVESTLGEIKLVLDS
jgi:uncharacterized coiled-coil protein SlyX